MSLELILKSLSLDLNNFPLHARDMNFVYTLSSKQINIE